MKGQKTLRVFSILMILVCVFGIVAGVLGILDVNNTKITNETETAEAEAQITNIEEKIAILGAVKADYKSRVAVLEQDKTTYESDKAAYETLKVAYDDKTAQFEAAKEAGQLDNSTIATTQTILEAGAAKLEVAQAKLIEYESNLAFVAEYEAGQAAVNTSLAKLSQKKAVVTKINSGMDPIVAAREALNEETFKENKELSARFLLCTAAMLGAVLAFIASVNGAGAAKIPSVGRIKNGIILGLFSLILVIVANIYGAMNDYIANLTLLTALVAEAIFALFFVIAISKYKNFLVNLMTSK